jgi:hypothetical protein
MLTAFPPVRPRSDPPDLSGLDVPRDATVPRQLAHKAAVENVFVTGVAAAGDGFVAAIELPRAHRHYNDVCVPYHDLLLLAEAARQGVEVVAHQLLGVPLRKQFVITAMRIDLVDARAARVGHRVAEMLAELRVSRQRRSLDGSLRSLDGEVYCWLGDRHAATFTGTVRFLPAETYGAVRAETDGAVRAETDGAVRAETAPAGPPVARRAEPSQVGRRDPANVVVGPLATDGTDVMADVVVDPHHPVFFDHPLDHHPGMLLLEACRQVALAAAADALRIPATRLLTTSCGGRFAGFAELHPAVGCRAAVTAVSDDRVVVAVTVAQQGREVAEVEIAVAATPEPADGRP